MKFLTYLTHLLILAFLVAFSACAIHQNVDSVANTAVIPSPLPASLLNLTDEQWQRAAEAVMQDREGALIINDPQTGRLRAVVNPRIAFNQAFPPGSTIKPFTALTALRAGLVNRETAQSCSGRYQRGSFSMLCSHPKSEMPFNLPHALGYSCNDYFGHLGERLSVSSVTATLTTFGFGNRTGANVAENAGQLSLGAWGAAESLGDSPRLLVTPLQLLNAYSALVNGGSLWVPQQKVAEEFSPKENSRVPLAANHRAILLEGMRGSVRYGTAAKAELDQVPAYVIGKTGTSSASNGFQTQGWFAAFLADEAAANAPVPEAFRVGIVVFLKRSHGSSGAEVVKKLLECGMRNAECGIKREDGANLRRGDVVTGRLGDTAIIEALNSALRIPHSALPGDAAIIEALNSALRTPHSALVKVRSVKENVTRELAFEDYITGVVGAEGSTEDELEALKALAVVSRTYALRNNGRHRADGYDFCSTTHCQRFVLAGRQREQVRRAVRETAGEILRDERGQAGDVYFHAACGGHTANVENLWGVSGRPYLRGVRDTYCSSRPNAAWTQTITARELAKALAKDPRTNVGASINEIKILKTDATGRAETIAIAGAQRKTIRGWEFKMIVGRGLGWQYLKSSRFTVERSGEAFVFTGGGFGHGLGLCQEGSHVMASRGMSYRQQLAFYLPGLSVREGATGRRGEGETGDVVKGSWGVGVIGRRGDGATERRGDGAMPLHEVSLTLAFAPEARGILAGGETTGNMAISNCAPDGVPDNQPAANGLFIPRSCRSANSLSACSPVGSPPANILCASGAYSETLQKQLARNDEHFHARYPVNESMLIESAWQTLHAARRRMTNDLSQAGLAWPARNSIEIVVYDSTAAFIQATGRAGWTAAVTTGNKIELQPLSLLQRRGVLAATLQHELTHAVVNLLSREKAPRWLSEGLAIRYANEGRALERVKLTGTLSMAELETQLAQPANAAKTRELYARAYRETQSLWLREGGKKVWSEIARRG